jgi:hypothetical protein
MKHLTLIKPRIQGTNGKEVLLQTTSTWLQWKLQGDASWQNLASLDVLAPGKMPSSGGVFTGNVQVKNILESSVNASIVNGSAILDMSNGSVFKLTMSADVSSLTITNIPSGGATSFALIVTQNATIAKNLSWTSNKTIVWPDSTYPLITSDLGKTDIFSFLTIDEGDTFYGFLSGQAY